MEGEGWPAERRACVGAGVGREGGARGARLWRAGPPQCRGRGRLRSKQPADQGGERGQGTAAGKATGLHLGQGGRGGYRVEVGAPIDRACDEKS